MFASVIGFIFARIGELGLKLEIKLVSGFQESWETVGIPSGFLVKIISGFTFIPSGFNPEDNAFREGFQYFLILRC